MRFTEPAPHNPWPHDMVIQVEDTPQHLTVLLFIREAWGIAAVADVPPLAPVPDTGVSRLPEVPGRNEWEARWHCVSERAWDWYSVQEPDPTVRPTPGYIRGFSGRGRDLNPLIPPFWEPDYGWDGIGADAFRTWQRLCSPSRHLAVSAVTRNVPASYTRALEAWARQS